MSARRTLAAAVMVAAVAPSASAGGPVVLDGSRRTHATHTATLTESRPATVGGERGAALFTPQREACTPASCDVTPIRLTLPRRVSAGRFTVSVVVPRQLLAHVVLYDAKGGIVGQRSFTDANDQAPVTFTPNPRYTLGFSEPRVAAGSYTLVVFNQGGTGEVAVSVDYRANPPDRQRPSA